MKLLPIVLLSLLSTTAMAASHNPSPSQYTSLRVLQLEESLEYAIEEGDQEYISKLTKNLAEAKAAEDAGTPMGPITGDAGQVSLGMFECRCIPAGATNVGPGAPAPNLNPDPHVEAPVGETPPGETPPGETPPGETPPAGETPTEGPKDPHVTSPAPVLAPVSVETTVAPVVETPVTVKVKARASDRGRRDGKKGSRN